MKEMKLDRQDEMRRGGVFFPERPYHSYKEYIEDFLDFAEELSNEQQLNLTK